MILVFQNMKQKERRKDTFSENVKTTVDKYSEHQHHLRTQQQKA